MKIKLNLTDLKKALKNVQKAIPTSPQLPILSSILFSLDKNKLTLAATDLYLGIVSTISVKNQEKKSLAVPGLMFKDLVNSFDHEEVDLEIKAEQIILQSGSSKAKLPIQSPKEYPDFPEINGEKITIPAEVVAEIVQLICYAASQDQVRPILTTIMFDFSDQGLEVAATDGFRLAVLKYPEFKTKSEQQILISARSFEEIYRIMDQANVEAMVVKIDKDLKQTKVEVDGCEIFVRLVEGEYPPYKKIIPEDFKIKVEVDGVLFREELQRASILAREASNIVKIKLQKDSLVITSVSPSLGEYSGEVVLITKGELAEEEIAFDIRYLLDFLNSTNPEVLEFCMNESLKPAAFNLKGRNDFTYVAMPFRVNN